MISLRVKLALTLLAALLLPSAPRAEGFSTTNVQLLQGWSFHDNLLGYDTKSGAMTTVTLNTFSTWAYGDSFAFVDLYRGEFVNGLTPTGSTSDIYAEWHPRLFLDQVIGLGALGPVRHWGLAAEINQARDFSAYMAGLGTDLAIPGFAVAGVNLYYRYSNVTLRFSDPSGAPASLNLYQHTWQLSPFWTVPFVLGPLRFIKLDYKGNQLYTWKVPPELPDGYLEVHTFSVDSSGNLYGGDNQYGRTQKFVPKPGADPALLIGAPWVAR